MGALCFLTGAGMSAESGVPTFRDAQQGLWARFDPMELATPEAWAADPARVWAWYVWRLGLVRAAEPHAGHRAIAACARQHPGGATLVTQNVDDLHERAGSCDVVHLHGSLSAFRCAKCETPWAGSVPAGDPHRERLDPPCCPACGGCIRPGVVWFGEALPEDAFAAAVDAVRTASTVVVIGTSSLVYPAASLPELAADLGKRVIEVNPVPTPLTPRATASLRMTAAEALPRIVAELVAETEAYPAGTSSGEGGVPGADPAKPARAHEVGGQFTSSVPGPPGHRDV